MSTVQLERESPARPYWLIPALLVLMLVPPVWAYVALGLVIGGSLARFTIRAARAHRADARAAREPGLGLGSERSGRPLKLTDHQLSAHGLIVGASGAGKSTTLLRLLCAQVSRGGPVIAIDMKGSPAFAGRLADAAAAAGRPFRIWSDEGSGRWNPLGHGNATELKDKLISTERFTEPHYQRAAERYVQTVLQVLQEAHPERPVTLWQVVDLMDPRKLGVLLRNVPEARARRVQDYLAGLTPDQLSAIRGLGARLAIITESHVAPHLLPGRRGIDVRSALEGREVVLFSLNSSTYGKLSAQIGTLVVQDLVAATGHRLREGGEQVLVGIDEFSALGADNVLQLLARGRESGVSVMLATQELADLERAAPGLRDQVLGVTALKIVHRQDVPSSAQMVAQMAGTRTVWERTYQIGRGPLGTYDRSRGTRRQVEQFVVHPNEIKSLPTGRAVVITKLPSASARIVDVFAPRSPAGGEGPESRAVEPQHTTSQEARPPASTNRPPAPSAVLAVQSHPRAPSRAGNRDSSRARPRTGRRGRGPSRGGPELAGGGPELAGGDGPELG